MSTIFALFKIEPKLDGHGCLHKDDEEIDYIECAKRSNGRGVYWMNEFHIISEHLPDETPIYPIDNDPQGIYTIGDIKKEMK